MFLKLSTNMHWDAAEITDAAYIKVGLIRTQVIGGEFDMEGEASIYLDDLKSLRAVRAMFDRQIARMEAHEAELDAIRRANAKRSMEAAQ